MNTPNKLTILRIILVPVFLVVYLSGFKNSAYIAFVLFLIASVTDTVDGYLARRNNQITDFGKFLDPLADKMLVICALVAMLDMGIANVYAVIIIIARELMVTSVRLVAAGSGKVIAAGMWGKAKTVVQFFAILALLIEPALLGAWETEFLASTPFSTTLPETTAIFGTILLWAAVALTIISGVEYLVKNRRYIDHKK